MLQGTEYIHTSFHLASTRLICFSFSLYHLLYYISITKLDANCGLAHPKPILYEIPRTGMLLYKI
jgi:hypothetical protein